MRSTTIVDNIKCNGCATRIKNKLNKIETISQVVINIEEGSVAFDCYNDSCRLEVISNLKAMGYPQQGQGSAVDNAKSYVSCMIGRIEK